eukprot:Hpha_TRINITY_DN3765_c0_g1::TRINITY_DN3765_c0_g1_i1::g.23928::m.23928
MYHKAYIGGRGRGGGRGSFPPRRGGEGPGKGVSDEKRSFTSPHSPYPNKKKPPTWESVGETIPPPSAAPRARDHSLAHSNLRKEAATAVRKDPQTTKVSMLPINVAFET